VLPLRKTARRAHPMFDAIHNRSHVLSPLFQTLCKLPDSNRYQIRLV
jgi:hypothetical protein